MENDSVPTGIQFLLESLRASQTGLSDPYPDKVTRVVFNSIPPCVTANSFIPTPGYSQGSLGARINLLRKEVIMIKCMFCGKTIDESNPDTVTPSVCCECSVQESFGPDGDAQNDSE